MPSRSPGAVAEIHSGSAPAPGLLGFPAKGLLVENKSLRRCAGSKGIPAAVIGGAGEADFKMEVGFKSESFAVNNGLRIHDCRTGRRVQRSIPRIRILSTVR